MRRRRARHLAGRLNGRVDVQQASALLVCVSPDVGCRAGEDLLHLGWRRGGTAVGVTVGLDHVGGGAGDERGRLAGAAKGLGRKWQRCLAGAGGSERQVAGGGQVHHIAKGSGAARRQGRHVVVQPALRVAIGLGEEPEVVRPGGVDDGGVSGGFLDRAGRAAVARALDYDNARLHHGDVRRLEQVGVGTRQSAEAVGLRHDVDAVVHRLLQPGDDLRLGSHDLTLRVGVGEVTGGENGGAGGVTHDSEGALRGDVREGQLRRVGVGDRALGGHGRDVSVELVAEDVLVRVRGIDDHVLPVGPDHVGVPGQRVGVDVPDDDALARRDRDRFGSRGCW